LAVNYEFPLGAAGLTGFVNGALTYTGNSATQFRPNDPLYRQLPAYTLANVRLGIARGNWRGTVFVDNLTDERAVLFTDARAGYDRDYVNRPRTLGITVRRTF
jgi:hypothetical protein